MVVSIFLEMAVDFIIHVDMPCCNFNNFPVVCLVYDVFIDIVMGQGDIVLLFLYNTSKRGRSG